MQHYFKNVANHSFSHGLTRGTDVLTAWTLNVSSNTQLDTTFHSDELTIPNYFSELALFDTGPAG